MALLSNILKPGGVFADIGANVGYDTLSGPRRVGLRGGVLVLE